MNLNKTLRSAIIELSKAGIKTAEIDARVLFRTVLDKDDVYLISHSDELITNAQYQKFRRYIRRRKKGEPIAYIIGHKEFYGLDFTVNKNVLIPRPETEALVENALRFLELKIKNKELCETDNLNVIDVGTGSGNIIISLAKNLSLLSSDFLARLYATDTSSKALIVAKKNAKQHQVYDNIRFFQSDLFNNSLLPNNFDLIIANLPYLDENNFNNKDHKSGTIGLDYEPKEALYAKDKGFEIVNKLIKQLPHKLNRNGLALIEADPSQIHLIRSLCSKNGLILKNIDDANKFKGLFTLTHK